MNLILAGSVLNFSAALLQVVPGASAVDWPHQVSQIGLTSALMIAVSILWRSKQKGDETLIQSLQAITKALADSATNSAELRKVIEAKLTCTCTPPPVPEEHVNGSGRKR